MQEKQAAPRVYTFRLNRSSAVVGLLGLVALVVGFVAPAQATPPGPDGAHKDYVCKYVGKPGVNERLQTGQNPIWVDTAATQGTWFNDAQGRSYVLIADTVKLSPEPDASQCPPPTPPPTTSTSSSSSSTTSGTGTHTTPPTSSTTSHTGTHTTPPTSTTSHTGTHTTPPTSTTTSSTSTSSTTSSTSSPTSSTSTETPSTGATSPTSSTTSPAPETPATQTPATQTPEVPATVAPTTPAAPGAAQPEVGAVNENAVPQAATDGADLMGATNGWGALRYGLVGSGALLLMAAGLLSMRRRHTF